MFNETNLNKRNQRTSHVHRAYDYLGPFGVLWVHWLDTKICLKKLQFINKYADNPDIYTYSRI